MSVIGVKSNSSSLIQPTSDQKVSNKSSVKTTKASPTTNKADKPKEQVIVSIMPSPNSGYTNKIYWSTDNFKTKHYIGMDNQLGSFNIGSFVPGTKIEFGINNGVDGFYRAGSAEKNPDNVVHAITKKVGNALEISFEDLHGGGDRNYTDAVIQVRRTPESAATSNTQTNNSKVNPASHHTGNLDIGTLIGTIDKSKISSAKDFLALLNQEMGKIASLSNPLDTLKNQTTIAPGGLSELPSGLSTINSEDYLVLFCKLILDKSTKAQSLEIKQENKITTQQSESEARELKLLKAYLSKFL